MRILVTGAGGYIGRQVVPLLRARGDEVCAAGREDDLLSDAGPMQLIARARPDAVIHLAWEATPGLYWTSPDNPRWTAATLALAEAARDQGVRRFVGAGTCAEYDWTGTGDLDEDVTPERPATPYGEAKLAAARGVQALCTDRFSTAWGRVFLLFGADEHPSRLVPSVAQALVAGEPALCSHGEQIRDFLHVTDVAGAFVALIDLIKAPATGVVNIASGEAHRVRDVIEGIADRLGRPDLVRLGARETHEPPRLVTRARRLREDVGWRPRVSFPQALDLAASHWSAR